MRDVIVRDCPFCGRECEHDILITWNNYRVVNCRCCRKTYEYRIKRVRVLDESRIEGPEIAKQKEYF